MMERSEAKRSVASNRTLCSLICERRYFFPAVWVPEEHARINFLLFSVPLKNSTFIRRLRVKGRGIVQSVVISTGVDRTVFQGKKIIDE